MDDSPLRGGSQTRVCDTGPQITPFSLSRGGSQRYSAKPNSWRKSDARDLRLRPHQPPQSLRVVGRRPGNPTPAVAGGRCGAFSNLSGCRHLRDLRHQQPTELAPLDSRLVQGDTLVVVSIDRIGRRWLDTMGNIHDLQRRGVRIRSLADNEQSWAQYLDADPRLARVVLGLYPGRLRRLGVRLGTGVDPPPYQGGFGEGEGERQETGRSSLVDRGAGGRGRRDGGQRSQPGTRRQVLRRITCDSQAYHKA